MRCIPLLVLAVVSLGLPAVAAATEASEVVARLIDQGSYYDFLANHLYTRTGNNRGVCSGACGADHASARDEIAAIFSGYGLSVEMEVVESASYQIHNVIATQYGVVDPSVQYIVGAHYDSLSNPGADDDASGVAGLLELARVLSQCQTAYTIKYIAFDAEELGLLGSKFYVNNHLSDDIRGMVQMDMIAFDPYDLFRVQFNSYEASAPLQSALADAFAEYSPLIYAVSGPGSSRSDHYPFEEAGFLGCLVIEDALSENPCYHQACDSVDTPDYIKYEYATEIVRGVAGFLADHANVTIPFDCSTGCAVSPSCDEDCDANGLCDLCEIACLGASDCNGNSLLDSCELADSGLDCNGNSVLDACDIASGFSTDCDSNGIPDACEVTDDPALDCDGNGIHDACDIASEPNLDCDNDGVLDECQLAADPSLDCDGSGTLDYCDTSKPFQSSSSSSSVVIGGSSGFSIRYAPIAVSDVVFRVSTKGNLRHDGVWAEVQLNGALIGNIFESSWSSCTESKVDELVIPMDLFNAAVQAGDAPIELYYLCDPCDYAPCSSSSYVYMSIAYRITQSNTDCNANGRPDTCDIADGTSEDCNANGVPDECQADVCPPSPDPMSFEPGGEPHGTGIYEIAMTAVEASDPSGVEYQFFGSNGPAHAGWRANRHFVHSGLMPNALQRYMVRAHDKASPANITDYSPQYTAATFIETPTGILVSDVTDAQAIIFANGVFTNFDLGQSGFYFELVPPHGIGANVWMRTEYLPQIEVTDLVPGTSYKVRAKARNQLAQETEWTDWVTFRTTGDNPCTLCGDLDGDDDVDPDDQAAFNAALASRIGDANYNPCADLDGDDAITRADFVRFIVCYRAANPGPDAPPDPTEQAEPAPTSPPRKGTVRLP